MYPEVLRNEACDSVAFLSLFQHGAQSVNGIELE